MKEKVLEMNEWFDNLFDGYPKEEIKEYIQDKDKGDELEWEFVKQDNRLEIYVMLFYYLKETDEDGDDIQINENEDSIFQGSIEISDKVKMTNILSTFMKRFVEYKIDIQDSMIWNIYYHIDIEKMDIVETE